MATRSLLTAVQDVCRRVQPPPEAGRTDQQLLDQFARQRDEAAFAVVLRRHGPMVMGVCRRLLGDLHAAEDAFQATFLVLASKAGTIPWRETVGSWLHQVAYRTARKAQVVAAQRRAREQEAGQMRASPIDSAVVDRDLGMVLDEELQRLPTRLRVPLLLCGVQGLSKTEAAQELGWKEGTVSSRLARGREVLRGRLLRRGVAVPAGGLTVLLVPNALSAAVSTKLENTTLAAALTTGGSASLAAGASVSAAALAHGVLRDLTLARLKVVLTVVLTVGILGSGSGLLLHRGATGTPATLSETPPEEPERAPPVERAEAARAAEPVRPVRTLARAWHQSTLPAKPDGNAWLTDFLTRIGQRPANPAQPKLHSFAPVVVGNRLFYRTYDGVWAIDRKREGKLKWFSYTVGGLASLLGDPGKKAYLNQWRTLYLESGADDIVCDNTKSGSLSTDGQRVYVVDDLVVPPPLKWITGKKPVNFGALTNLVNCSVLHAYNLESGKLVWDLSGHYDKNTPLAGSFFLGSPLPLNGKLYVLNEKDGDLRLACLEPHDTIDQPIPTPPTIAFVKKLAAFRERLPQAVFRRIRAIQPVHHDGILVCPTHDGAVLGFDLRTGDKAWTYTYRNANVPAPTAAAWRFAAPMIANGKVVFTAPDDAAIHCINLRDGQLAWKADPDDDLYLAGVFGNKVLLVGKNRCRCLDLTDGKPLWHLITGVPSGRGVAVGQHFYLLPLRAMAPTWQPGICALYVEKGVVLAQALTPGSDVPGNLVLTEEGVLSQTVTGVASYAPFPLPQPDAAPIALDGGLTAEHLNQLWSDLQTSDVSQAAAAVLILAAFPRQAVPHLRQKVRPVRVDEARIARLASDLDSAQFPVRQRAAEDLEKLGELAEPALRKLLADKPNLDLRQRADQLLEKIEQTRQVPTPAGLRQQRAGKVLELIGNDQARQLLKELAQGAGGARQTIEARAALERLENRATLQR